MSNETQLTDEEIKNLILSAKSPGLRDTVSLYLLDYIKHCFLEEGQLQGNISKLQNALPHLEGDIKKGVEDVLDSLKCVEFEYNEYQEDMKVFSNDGYLQGLTLKLKDNSDKA